MRAEPNRALEGRGGAPAAGAPATWGYTLRCTQLLATLSKLEIVAEVALATPTMQTVQDSWKGPGTRHAMGVGVV